MSCTRILSGLLVFAGLLAAQRSFAAQDNCQYKKIPDGVIEVCPNVGPSGLVESFDVAYSNGLLNKSRNVFVGALTVVDGHEVNLLTERGIPLEQDGNYIGHAHIPAGANHLEIYFFTMGNSFDSNYDQNYSFEF